VKSVSPWSAVNREPAAGARHDDANMATIDG
jgi:hypothetical protein